MGAAVRVLEAATGELARAFKAQLLQDVIDWAVERALGAPRGGARRRVATPWACAGCGPRMGSELKRNGRYLRRPLVSEGPITLRVRQLVCRTREKAVPFSHPPLPRRKSLSLDLDRQVNGPGTRRPSVR